MKIIDLVLSFLLYKRLNMRSSGTRTGVHKKLGIPVFNLTRSQIDDRLSDCRQFCQPNPPIRRNWDKNISWKHVFQKTHKSQINIDGIMYRHWYQVMKSLVYAGPAFRRSLSCHCSFPWLPRQPHQLLDAFWKHEIRLGRRMWNQIEVSLMLKFTRHLKCRIKTRKISLILLCVKYKGSDWLNIRHSKDSQLTKTQSN